MSDKGLWWNGYAHSFAQLEYPVLIVDEQLEPVFENESGNKIELEHIYRHIGERQFFLHSNSTLFDQLRQNYPVRLPVDDVLEDRMAFLLKPVLHEERLLGCIVTLSRHELPPDSAYQNSLSRGTAALSYRMRSGTAGILSSASRIASYNDRELGDPELYEYVNAITQHAYHLVRTNAHITQFNRYKLERDAIKLQWQDICRFTAELCHVMSPMVCEKMQFTYSVPGDIVPALFDSQIIAAVLMELTSNAMKFAGENGKMRLTLSIHEDNAEFRVEDNGLGIAGDVAGYVFEPFFSHDPRTHSICGDGLGLWLSREGVRLHGGRMMVDSREGEGTSVMFSIPLSSSGRADDSFEVRSVAAEYMRNRFSDLFVLLSDVCKPPLWP